MHEQSELQFIKAKAGKTCPTCGGEVIGRSDKVYCSRRCKKAAWHEANPEKVKKSVKKWQKANPEKVRAMCRNYYKANAEKVKEQKKRHYEAHTEKVKARTKKWKKANPEKHKKSVKKWQKANPEKCKEYCHRRRARIMGNGFEDTSEFRARMTHPLVRQICFYCGKDCTSSGEWHWDHRIPLAAGGPEAAWNLVIACVSCNLKKGSKYPKTLFAEEIFNEP